MKQKLALMGALLHDPRLFILDEPMAGLDPRSSHLFKELLRKHCDRGNAVFFSTHILEVAERLCDRVGIINRGRLIASGTLEELRAMHKTDESLEDIFLELTGPRSLEAASLETTMETRSPDSRAGIKAGIRAGIKDETGLPTGAGKGDRGR